METDAVTKNVYVTVSKDLWGKVKLICFKRGITLRQYVTELLEKDMKRK